MASYEKETPVYELHTGWRTAIAAVTTDLTPPLAVSIYIYCGIEAAIMTCRDVEWLFSAENILSCLSFAQVTSSTQANPHSQCPYLPTCSQTSSCQPTGLTWSLGG